ncbi:MAG: GNAT family N-acetyltransferase [Cytophagales bacterium]|nr:GNAT family N-acetyltransferase [Cytophagales bacterium]
MKIKITVAGHQHTPFAGEICDLLARSAKERGTGIAKRTIDYIAKKMEESNAVIALDGNEVAGFCYIEIWGGGKFLANSGLIVKDRYRDQGLGKKIKNKIFQLSRKKYPEAKIFGITTSMAVMKINSELGYKPVTFSTLTDDESFWNGCQSCQNYDILQRNQKKMCLCTGMLYNPKKNGQKFNFGNKGKILKRLKNIKQSMFLKKK